MKVGFVERLDMINQAQAVLREQHLLIAAAAGYGKSVLLRQLMGYLPNSTYLQLTVDDDDVAVLRQRVKDADAETLLLDDVHLLSADSDATVWLSDQLADSETRYLVAGRYLPFDATLLLAQSDAVRWDENELTFSAEMTAQLLPQNALAWHDVLHGWPLGVGLLLQLPTVQRGTVAARDHLFNYLAQAVFEQLPADLKYFLQSTAAPRLFSAELATHLTGYSSTDTQLHLTTLLQRNLFIYPTEQAQYRYHDLFRAFLQEADPSTTQALQEKTAYWFLQQQAYVQSIEHFFEANNPRQALTAMADSKETLLTSQGRQMTYRRWLGQSDRTLLQQFPELVLTYIGRIQYDSRLDAETIDLFDLIDSTPNLAETTRHSITVQRANFCRAKNQLSEAIALVEPLIEQGVLSPEKQCLAAQIAAICLSEQLHLLRTRRFFAIAHEAALQLNSSRVRNVDGNTATVALGYLGQFERCFATFDRLLAEEPSPYWQIRFRVQIAIIAFRCGDRERIATCLQEIEQLRDTVEHVGESDERWIAMYGVLLQGLQNPGQQPTYRGEDIWNISDPSSRIWGISMAVSLARLIDDQEMLTELAPQAAVAAQTLHEHAFERAYICVELDIANGLRFWRCETEQFALTELTKKLIGQRCRNAMMRIQALLTLVCFKQGNPRWQRLARRVLRMHKEPFYSLLLTQRDPFLGAAFWPFLLREGIGVAVAQAALVKIGMIEPLLPLLEHTDHAVRLQVAECLVKIKDERAMKPISRAITATQETMVKATLQSALHVLESSPPPPIRLTLMGGFHAQRGEEEISDFHRPIVSRLLQYFAINRGKPIARDRILEDIWPDKAPDKAWATFRTVYSRLRNTLEPHMRSKGPNRYFMLDGDSYTFDPNGYVTTDVEQFSTAITNALANNQQLPQATSQHLASYATILPDLPYADWLLEPRERALELYVNGGLRLGQELLASGDSAEAQQWAQRILRDAPWLEAAWQLLMRAYSRQNLRSRALRAYLEAQEALQSELAVNPSPLTEWLHKRLEAGETV